MTRRKDTAPPPVVCLMEGRLVPVSAYEAEEIDRHPDGTEFDLVARKRRSLPQLRTYWRMLDNAVKATGRWQSREALHTALKVELGYVEPIFGMDGKIKGMIPDSTAFAAMNADAFRQFFDKAVKVLAEATGTDPLAWLEDAA